MNGSSAALAGRATEATLAERVAIRVAGRERLRGARVQAIYRLRAEIDRSKTLLPNQTQHLPAPACPRSDPHATWDCQLFRRVSEWSA